METWRLITKSDQNSFSGKFYVIYMSLVFRLKAKSDAPMLQEEPVVRSDYVVWDFSQMSLGTLQGLEPGQSVSACFLPVLTGKGSSTQPESPSLPFMPGVPWPATHSS